MRVLLGVTWSRASLRSSTRSSATALRRVVPGHSRGKESAQRIKGQWAASRREQVVHLVWQPHSKVQRKAAQGLGLPGASPRSGVAVAGLLADPGRPIRARRIAPRSPRCIATLCLATPCHATPTHIAL